MKEIVFVLGFVLCVAGCVLFQQKNDDLVYHCTFDSAAAVERPVVGSVGKLRNAQFRKDEGRDVLYVPVGAGVVDVDLPNGLPTDRGCIEFDAKILATKNFFINGGDPRFFSIRATEMKGWNFVALCDFNGNNGVGDSGLYTQIGHAVMTSQPGRFGHFPYASVPGMENYKAWHHYLIAWNLNGVGGTPNLAEVRIDGRLVTTSPVATMDPVAFRKLMSQKSVLHFSEPFDTRGIGNSKTPFLIDDFKIWKTDVPPTLDAKR